MLDNGYSLAKIELLNWGNFHGYQKFNLKNDQGFGPLFSPPPASAILGINGSGKSTLIDGIMMTLLPFEKSLKLGVTNDAETGSGGGRSIKDYVLGKFASTDDGQSANLGKIYGRSEGCSIFFLVFQHNRFPDRLLSVGRIWWFQSHRVMDSNLGFIRYQDLSMAELCAKEQVPRGPKQFKDSAKALPFPLQIFESAESYFTALSGSLGQISRDDLKILNRAFYVKSISQIDQFIRENMLIEESSPKLDILLENVRNGREIAHAIDHCEQKIRAIEKIIGALKKLLASEALRDELEIKKKLLSLYKEWIQLEDANEELKALEKEITDLNRDLPRVQNEVTTANGRTQSLKAQLLQSDLAGQILQIETEIKHLREKLSWWESERLRFSSMVKNADLKVPLREKDVSIFQDDISKNKTQCQARWTNESAALEGLREKKFIIDGEAKRLKMDLDHLAQAKTFIPRELYAIKESLIEDLDIPADHLAFVGELIQVKDDFKGQRRAVESVLFPISRNLLCHPKELTRVTKWLDGRGLKSDVTVKRISNDELAVLFGKPDFSEDSILSMISVLELNKNPFRDYLWRWLADVFDYRLVEVGTFKTSEGKLVTPEGLVKTDSRTMRKLKQGFSFSLGWDTQEQVAELTQKLVTLNTQHLNTVRDLATGQTSLKALEDRLVALRDLASFSSFEFLKSEETLLYIAKQEARKDSLIKGDKDYQKLREEARRAEELERNQRRLLADLESKGRASTLRVEKLKPMVAKRTKDIAQSEIHAELCTQFGSFEALEEKLRDFREHILQKGLSLLKEDADLAQELRKLESKRDESISRASAEVVSYQRAFNDPNLPSALTLQKGFEDFQQTWQAALDRLIKTDLPTAQDKWRKFFDQVLMDSVKDMVNEIKAKFHGIEQSIESINEVLKLANFEDLLTEQRYLKIHSQTSQDERVRKFRRQMTEVEKILGPTLRVQMESQSQPIMKALQEFVEKLQEDPNYRAFVTDVRNHFQFKIHSLRRKEDGMDEIVEILTGARKDAKSSAQTTQLAYTLLASCLAYRFKIHDPVLGQDTPRILILDEFGGKFDNEKPREVLKLLAKMGFQAILVSPMSKGDLLAESIGQLVLVHKASAERSKVQSYPISSRQDFEALMKKFAGPTTSLAQSPSARA